MSERSRVLLCPRPTYRAGHATASHTPGLRLHSARPWRCPHAVSAPRT